MSSRIKMFGAAALTLVAIVLVGCAQAVTPLASERALSVSDRVSNALLVTGANTTDGVTTFSRIVTSCGGTVTIDPTVAGEYVVSILMDPTGALDAAIERANGDLSAVDTARLSLPVFWSQRLAETDLPQWITVDRDGVTISGQGPRAGTATPPCPTFAPTPLPSAVPSAG